MKGFTDTVITIFLFLAALLSLIKHIVFWKIIYYIQSDHKDVARAIGFNEGIISFFWVNPIKSLQLIPFKLSLLFTEKFVLDETLERKVFFYRFLEVILIFCIIIFFILALFNLIEI